jgi:hypothetical protein
MVWSPTVADAVGAESDTRPGAGCDGVHGRGYPPAVGEGRASRVERWPAGSPSTVPGIVGDADLNLFNGNAIKLTFYGEPGAVVPPVDPPSSNFVVGDGIRARMAALGDQPASDEEYVARGWSEAVGTSGRVYRWVKSSGAVLVFGPAA